MNELLTNLAAGFRLATLRSIDRGAYQPSPRQALLLGASTVLLAVASARIVRGAAVEDLLESLRASTAEIALLVLAATVLARTLRRPSLLFELPVILLSVSPAVHLTKVGAHFLSAVVAVGHGGWLALGAMHLAWLFAVSYRGMAVATGLRPRVLIPVYGLYLAASMLAVLVFPGYAAP